MVADDVVGNGGVGMIVVGGRKSVDGRGEGGA